MVALRDPRKAIGVAGEGDVAFQVRGLELELVRLDNEPLDEERQDDKEPEHSGEKAAGEVRHEACPIRGQAPVQQRGEHCDRCGSTEERVAADDDVGVAGPEHGAGGARQEGVAVEQVAGGPCEQEQIEVHDEVAAGRGRCQQPDAGPVIEETGTAVGYGQDEEHDQGGRRHYVLNKLEQGEGEEVEAEVVTEHGVDPAERLTPEEAQDSVPAARRNEADDDRRRQRHSREQPARVRAKRAQGRRVNGRPRRTRRAVRRRGLVDPAAQGDEVQQHVGVSDQASYGEQSRP